MTGKWAIVAEAHGSAVVVMDFRFYDEAVDWAQRQFTPQVKWLVVAVRHKKEYNKLVTTAVL